MARDRVPGIALSVAIALTGAAVFLYFKGPLPIFLGALTFCITASILRLPLKRPLSLSIPSRIVLGLAVGSAFTPALLGRASELAITLSLIIPFSMFITAAGYLFYRHVARFDGATAFFGSVPGGLTDMVTMSEDAGANQRAVTLISASRMVLIVFFVPLYMAFYSGVEVGGALVNTIHIWEMHPLNIALLVVLGFVGWVVARALGLAGAAIVGPMILSGLVHVSGLTDVKVPTEALWVAQLALGILLGAQFRELTLREFTGSVVWGFAFSAIVLIVSVFLAMGLSAWTGADKFAVLMAYAPGGQSELNLLAITLNLDVAFIALHHLVRVAAVIIGAQIVFRMNPTWRARALERQQQKAKARAERLATERGDA
jgi:membrane AbrB-like protein